MGSEAKRKANKKYDSINVIKLYVKLNKKTDADIIEYIKNAENKQGTFKKALRLLMQQEKRGSNSPRKINKKEI